jgi:hypothetical protein
MQERNLNKSTLQRKPKTVRTGRCSKQLHVLEVEESTWSHPKALAGPWDADSFFFFSFFLSSW